MGLFKYQRIIPNIVMILCNCKLTRYCLYSGGANSSGSQFFVTFQETPSLEGQHVVFGRIIEGMDVLDDIEVSGSVSSCFEVKLYLYIYIYVYMFRCDERLY